MTRRVLELFWSHEDLLRRFNSFLPEGYHIVFPSDSSYPSNYYTGIHVETPVGVIEFSNASEELHTFQPDSAAIVRNILPIIQSSVSSLPFHAFLE